MACINFNVRQTSTFHINIRTSTLLTWVKFLWNFSGVALTIPMLLVAVKATKFFRVVAKSTIRADRFLKWWWKSRILLTIFVI